jgi:hypothetical protein
VPGESPVKLYFIRCLHNLLNVLVQIANKMGLQGKKILLTRPSTEPNYTASERNTQHQRPNTKLGRFNVQFHDFTATESSPAISRVSISNGFTVPEVTDHNKNIDRIITATTIPI